MNKHRNCENLGYTNRYTQSEKMKESYMYIIQSDGKERELKFEELNMLKKDILWIYDENIWQVNAAFAPNYSFKMKYWEYLSLNGDKWFCEEEREFYQIGSMIILLCFCVEYNDIASGDQKVFKREEIPIVIEYVQNFDPKDEPETKLKNKVLLGLKIANSMTDEQLLNSDFVHDWLDEFYQGLKAIGDDFISYYYEMKLKK